MALIREKDNSGKTTQSYVEKLTAMTDEELSREMTSKIWLSAYAANNPRSDYHWQCDATWNEGQRRGKPELYERAHAKLSSRD